MIAGSFYNIFLKKANTELVIHVFGISRRNAHFVAVDEIEHLENWHCPRVNCTGRYRPCSTTGSHHGRELVQIVHSHFPGFILMRDPPLRVEVYGGSSQYKMFFMPLIPFFILTIRRQCVRLEQAHHLVRDSIDARIFGALQAGSSGCSGWSLK